MENLAPGFTYTFKVRTFTPAHGSQQNALTSSWSAQSEPVPLPATATPTAVPLRQRYLPLSVR